MTDINKINIPSFLCSKIPVPQVNDQISITNKNNMRIYCSLFDHLEEYINKDNIDFHPETLLAYHLEKNSLDTNEFDLKYDLSAFRRDDVFILEQILQHMVYEIK